MFHCKMQTKGGAANGGGSPSFFLRLLPHVSFDEHISFGKTAMASENYLSAAHHFRAAVKKNHSSEQAHLNLGKALAEHCRTLADSNISPPKNLLHEAIAEFEDACLQGFTADGSLTLHEAHFEKAKFIFEFRAHLPQASLNEAFMCLDAIVGSFEGKNGPDARKLKLLAAAQSLRKSVELVIKGGYAEIEAELPLSKETAILECKN